MKLRQVVLALGIIGLFIVILLNRHQFVTFWHLLINIKLYYLIAVVIVQLFSYYLNALYYRSILRAFKYEIGLMRLFEGAMSSNFVNYIFPTAGMGGAVFLSQVLKPEVPRGQGFLTQIMRYVLSSIAVAMFIPVSILLLAATDHSDATVFEGVIVAAFLILTVGIIIYKLVRNEKLVRRLLNWLSHKFHFLKSIGSKSFADDFYSGFHEIFGNVRTMFVPYVWSVTYIVVEVFTMYLAFLALGRVVNPGIVLMGYIVANISSVFGGAIISVGAFEVSLTGILVALGQPFAFALSVTLIYRVLNMIIGLPPGFIYYRKYIKKTA